MARRGLWVAVSLLIGVGCSSGSAERAGSSEDEQDVPFNDPAPASDQQPPSNDQQPLDDNPEPADPERCASACVQGRAGCDLGYCVDHCLSTAAILGDEYVGCENQVQAYLECLILGNLLTCRRDDEPDDEAILRVCRSQAQTLAECVNPEQRPF